MQGWAQYWTELAHAHHLLEQHDAEAELARTREYLQDILDYSPVMIITTAVIATDAVMNQPTR